MILFLPPAPKSGEFFDTIRMSLSDFETTGATYPGYGDVPKTTASIEAYATSFLPLPADTTLVGFHTGCLVALEIALQSDVLPSLILVDIPYYDTATRRKYSAALDADNPNDDAFRAAFAYDLQSALERTFHAVTCVASGSPLFEPTLKAARILKNSTAIERPDITKPVFESGAMADLIRELAA